MFSDRTLPTKGRESDYGSSYQAYDTYGSHGGMWGMGKSVALLTLEVQRDYGWTHAFANAYVCGRYVEGLSHQRAYSEAMRSPFVRESDKPRL